jgi:hypothetical protein
MAHIHLLEGLPGIRGPMVSSPDELCEQYRGQRRIAVTESDLRERLYGSFQDLSSIQGSENARDLPKVAALVGGKHAESAIHGVPHACVHGRLDLHFVNGKAGCRG